MRRLHGVLAAALLVTGLAAAYTGLGQRRDLSPTLLLISLDGFGASFLELGETPTLSRLAREGVHARDGMVPIFPTRTFPNHYAAVTGLYAEHHGIVGNTMYDPEFRAEFSLRDRDAVGDARWWGGEPIWVTAETQGQVAGAYFWVGSEAPVAGVQPTYWKEYDGRVPNEDRVDEVLRWLDLPRERRPSFITLYFSTVDGAAHRSGTESSELRAALRRVDAAIARLVAGLDERGIGSDVNLMIIADHGMADISPDRMIFLDDMVDLSIVRVIPWSIPFVAIWPQDGREDEVYRALVAGHSRWRVYRKDEIPDRFHYQDHRRVAPIIAVADEGWSIASRARFRPDRYGGATHGWDNELLSMRALFIARGPAFRSGVGVEPFQIIHLYELMCAILGLEPAENDGSLDSVRVMLRK